MVGRKLREAVRLDPRRTCEITNAAGMHQTERSLVIGLPRSLFDEINDWVR
jgi:hypothetical protein